ncbi:hypothetical protein G5C60_37305 [Streptomyces sp. HC44]|uniref:Uncharacterized protein n=1 Tax=Streptomyces scabichelini TaxID=2711217 RepID=A0A6G4VH44_9ACTN|nr:hypothetical protein [Streptomyces scabichelini]NGO13107.1 hypothetical protein [Streptomyces scabichelini]
MTGLGRGPHDDRERDILRFHLMELTANLLALLSILAVVLVIVLAADAVPVLIAATATAASAAFRAWLAFRHRHPPGERRKPTTAKRGASLPGPRRSPDGPPAKPTESAPGQRTEDTDPERT